MMTRRVDIDTAKGIGMLLVVIGHATPPASLQEWIYGAHMPLFFVLSGMLWSGRVRLGHSARSLLRPFAIGSLLSWGVWIGKQYLHPSGSVPWWGPLLATVYGGDIGGYLVHNTPLWFLPALFSLLGCLWLLRHLLSIEAALVGLAIAGATVMALSPQWSRLGALPLSLGQGLVGGLFFALGFATRSWLNHLRGWPVAAVWLAGSVFYGGLVHLNGRVDLFSMTFGHPLIYVACGMLGSMLILMASRWSRLQWNVLQLVGRHSLIVLIVHLPVLWLVRALLPKLHLPAVWYLLSLLALGLILPVLMFRDRSQALATAASS